MAVTLGDCSIWYGHDLVHASNRMPSYVLHGPSDSVAASGHMPCMALTKLCICPQKAC